MGVIPKYCKSCCAPQQFETEEIKKSLYRYYEDNKTHTYVKLPLLETKKHSQEIA
jgi:hypothetical protein